MSENTPTTATDKQALEALKMLGKTLGQMTLYKIGHPAVAATIQLAHEQLTAALSATPEIAFSIDGDKVVCNGHIAGPVSSLPNSIPTAFNRFKVSTLTFRPGITTNDIAVFCELCSIRPGPGAPASPTAYLAEKGVTTIALNEAVYAKMSGAPVAQATAAETAGAPGSPEQAEAEAAPILAAAETSSVDATINALVQRAVTDPLKRAEVYQKVMDLLKGDIEKRIDEAVKPLKEERNMLANEQQRTQSVLQNMVDGVVVVDDQGKILMMNPAAEQVYGTTLAQAAGQHVAAKAGEEHIITLAAEINTPKDREIKKDVQVAGEADTKRTLQTAGAIVQNEQGKVVGMVNSLSDVAKHKEMQRMQRDFIAHVTHELRAPLSSIRAALEILQGETAGRMKEDESRMLGTAMKNSDRLADLINSILDFSKIESGQMQVYPKKADAERIGREAVDSLAAWASKKRLNLSLVAVPNIPATIADQPRTVQVIINLLSNAIKFTPVGGSITVRVGPESGGNVFEPNDKFVMFSVTDTGAGIPKDQQSAIFEKFVQIASGEMHVGGTGLGLAIAKALVHLQGGKMWVESEPGKGATFKFTLPLWTASGEAATTTQKKPKAEAAPLPWWKKLLGLK